MRSVWIIATAASKRAIGWWTYINPCRSKGEECHGGEEGYSWTHDCSVVVDVVVADVVEDDCEIEKACPVALYLLLLLTAS